MAVKLRLTRMGAKSAFYRIIASDSQRVTADIEQIGYNPVSDLMKSRLTMKSRKSGWITSHSYRYRSRFIEEEGILIRGAS